MRDAILSLLDRAMKDADSIPSSARADLYDAVAELLKSTAPELGLSETCDAAAKAAKCLRDADASQLIFESLLRPAS